MVKDLQDLLEHTLMTHGSAHLCASSPRFSAVALEELVASLSAGEYMKSSCCLHLEEKLSQLQFGKKK